MQLLVLVTLLVVEFCAVRLDARAIGQLRRRRQAEIGFGQSGEFNMESLMSLLTGRSVSSKVGGITTDSKTEIGIRQPGIQTSENNCWFGICTRKTLGGGDLSGGLQNFGGGENLEMSFPLLKALIGLDLGTIGRKRGLGINPFTGKLSVTDTVQYPFGIQSGGTSNFEFPGFDLLTGGGAPQSPNDQWFVGK